MQLTHNNQNFNMNPDETVLECLERNRIAVPSSCRSGVCKSCLLKADRGKPPPESQSGLKTTQVEQNHFLSCMARPTQDLSVSLIGESGETMSASIIEKRHLAPDVVLIRLKCQKEFAFRPGQFINLVRHDGLIRPYSIASIPRDGFVELHVRRVEDGMMSQWLYDTASVGEQMHIRGPNGECFYVVGQPRQRLILIGSGTGLAPLIGILRDALEQQHHGKIHLFHAGKRTRDLYLDDEILGLTSRHSNLDYHASLLEEPDTAKQHITTQRLEEIVIRMCPDLKGARAYLCGNPKMVKSLKEILYKNGVELDDIHADEFITGQAKTSASIAPDRIQSKINSYVTESKKPHRQLYRLAIQTLVFAGFILQGLLYYKFDFKPLGNLLPFMAYDSIGHKVISSAVMAWGILFFLTMIFGRFACGWMCPFGMIQDVGVRILNGLKIQLPKPLNQPRLARYILVSLILGSFILLPLMQNHFAVWQLDMHFREPWLLGFPFRIGLFILDLSLIFLVLGIILPLAFGARPYCKLVCETGMLLDRFSTLSLGKIRRNHGFDQNTCLSCQKCTNICPQGIHVYQEIQNFDQVVNTNCIACVQCVDTCPNDTILYSLKPKIVDPAKVRGYLATENFSLKDIPRFAFTTIGVVTGAIIGFFVMPASYIHTYLIFSSLGGLSGWLIWKIINSVLEKQDSTETQLQKAALSLTEREAAMRILPLSSTERLSAVPQKTGYSRQTAIALASLLFIAGLLVLSMRFVPPRIQSVSEIDAKYHAPLARANEKLILIGIPPVTSSADMHTAYANFVKNLNSAMKYKTVLVSGTTYTEVSRAFVRGWLDAAILPPVAFLKIRNHHQNQLGKILQTSIEGKTTYTGVLLSKSRAILKVDDLKEKRIAFTAMDSLSGYVAPMATFKSLGLRESDFAEILFSGNHSHSFGLLLSDRVDVIATYDGAWKHFKMKNPGIDLHVIKKFDDLPNDVLVTRSDMDKMAREKLLRHLESPDKTKSSKINTSLKAVGFDAFVPFDENIFEPLQSWLDDL